MRDLGTAAWVLFSLGACAADGVLFEATFDGSCDGRGRAGTVKAATTGAVERVAGHQGRAWRSRPGATCAYATAGVLGQDTGTIEMWVQPAWDASDGVQHYLLVDERRQFKVFKHTSGHLYAQIYLNRPKRAVVAPHGPVSWRAGEWHHVAVAWQGFEGADTDVVAAVYVDGKCIGWNTAVGALAALGKRFWVGSDIRGRHPFDGAVDEVRVHAKPTVELFPSRLPAVALPTPKDDPDVATTEHLPPGPVPDPWHRLDTVRDTVWAGFPTPLARDHFGDSPAQRVIYRDTVTGAEVWLLTRSAANEGVAYTNYFPFNADGSRIRIWCGSGLCMASDGSAARPFKTLIPHEFYGVPQWHKTDPNRVVCRTANGGRFEFDLAGGTRRDLFVPDDSIPPRTDIQFNDDGQRSMFISRQGSRRPFFFQLGDGPGHSRQTFAIKSVSPNAPDDRMGSAAFIRDQFGKLYARYSLNKGRKGDTPYQNWLVEMAPGPMPEGRRYRRMDSHNNLLDGTSLHFVPAGSFVVTGHGGYAPSGRAFIHHRNRSGYKWIRDLATWEQRDIARIPGCDHMDWTVDDNWFFVWASQRGLPIYKCYVDSGVTHRIVCTNSCPHTYQGCPYHGSSPDGTKLLYKSIMFGNLDVYMAIVRYPHPPARLSARREGQAAVLSWEAPKGCKEVAGYHVYRSAKTGRGRQRLSQSAVRGTEFRIANPAAGDYYAVTSVEHCGLEGRVFSPEAALSDRGPATRCLEAEQAALTYPMRELFRPRACSAGYAIGRAIRGPMWQRARGVGKAEWTVALPRTASYALWVRARQSRDAAPASFALDGRPAGQVQGQGEAWSWQRASARPVKLMAGPHKLVATMDQPGVELDKLLFTSDPSFTPEGMGDAPTAVPAEVDAMSAQYDPAAELVRLRWAPCEAAGLHHYQLYRGYAPDFEPVQSRLLGSPTRAAFLDPGPFARSPVFYRVVAVGNWGHRSPASAPARVSLPPLSDAVSIMVELEAGSQAKGARVAEDGSASGGRCVAFGQPNEIPEHAGEATAPVDAAPGRYALWLRVKGGPRKRAAFLWVRLGKTEHYSRIWVSLDYAPEAWVWRQVTFLNSVRSPQEHRMWYNVSKRPTTLAIRHRANYVAIDRAFITTSALARPSPECGIAHPGCAKTFPRRDTD